MLEHHAAVVAAAFHFAPVDGDLAGARALETHGDAQRGGLAAARRADEGYHLALAHGEIQTLKRVHGLQCAVDVQREALGEVDDVDFTHRRYLFFDRFVFGYSPAFFSRVDQYSQARACGRGCKLRSQASLHSPGVSGLNGMPCACVSSCSSALR